MVDVAATILSGCNEKLSFLHNVCRRSTLVLTTKQRCQIALLTQWAQRVSEWTRA